MSQSMYISASIASDGNKAIPLSEGPSIPKPTCMRVSAGGVHITTNHFNPLTGSGYRHLDRAHLAENCIG